MRNRRKRHLPKGRMFTVQVFREGNWDVAFKTKDKGKINEVYGSFANDTTYPYITRLIDDSGRVLAESR